MSDEPAYRALATRLRGEIIAGVWRPGQRLPTESQLIARTGAGRSTIREALRLLASEHLIVTTRGQSGGSFVTSPDSSTVGDSLATGVGRLLAAGAIEARDLIDVRRLIEVPAAGLAAGARDDEDLARMERAMFGPDTNDEEQRIAAHAAFHLAVAAASGNPLLAIIARPLYTVSSHDLRTETTPEVWRVVDQDHRRLLAAIRDRDAARARALAAEHLDNLA